MKFILGLLGITLGVAMFFVISIVFDVIVSSIVLALIDFFLGTSYFTAQYVAIMTVILFLIGLLRKSKDK